MYTCGKDIPVGCLLSYSVAHIPNYLHTFYRLLISCFVLRFYMLLVNTRTQSTKAPREILSGSVLVLLSAWTILKFGRSFYKVDFDLFVFVQIFVEGCLWMLFWCWGCEKYLHNKLKSSESVVQCLRDRIRYQDAWICWSFRFRFSYLIGCGNGWNVLLAL